MVDIETSVKVILFDTNNIDLAKVVYFFRKNKIPVESADAVFDLERACIDKNCIVYQKVNAEKILALKRKKRRCRFALIQCAVEIEKKWVTVQMNENLCPAEKLTVLKIRNYLELFFIEKEFNLSNREYRTSANLKHSYYFDEVLFDNLPKSLYKLFIKICEHDGGISPADLYAQEFSNEYRTANLMYVQVSKLRKALGTIPDCDYRLTVKDKKYRVEKIM